MMRMVMATTMAALLGIAGCAKQPAAEVTGEQSADAAVAAESVSFNVENAPTVVFNVPKMMCENSCVPAVRKTLAAQPGVNDVKVVLADKTATVAVDKGTFDPEAAIAALVDLQFTGTTLVNEHSDAGEASVSPSVEKPAKPGG